MPDFYPCYVDCANLDLGDLAMPVVDRETMTTHYAPSARFGVARGQTRPVLLMLDEDDHLLQTFNFNTTPSLAVMMLGSTMEMIREELSGVAAQRLLN
jgi:hypothetical protein